MSFQTMMSKKMAVLPELFEHHPETDEGGVLADFFVTAPEGDKVAESVVRNEQAGEMGWADYLKDD